MNRAKILKERSLRSALNQKFSDYEVLVIDGGSDDSEKVVEESRRKHLYYFKVEPKGLSHARNFGIKKSKGEYIVCLDDDNELMPDFLRKTIDNIGDYDAITTGRVIQYKDFAHEAVPKLGRFCSIDWGWLIRRDVFDTIQYDEEMKANEDADFGIQFFKRFKAKVIPDLLAVAYDEFGDPRNSMSFPNQRELRGMLHFLEKNLKEYDDPNELRYLYRLCGRKFYRGGFRLKGLSFFWKSFRACPNLNSFLNLFFILFGWTIYDKFMTLTEKLR